MIAFSLIDDNNNNNENLNGSVTSPQMNHRITRKPKGKYLE